MLASFVSVAISGLSYARPISGGGCCLESGECVDTTPQTCEELGGEFAGMDLYCWRGDVQCEGEGRCCLPCPMNGLLCREDFDADACSLFGGQWLANATCDTDACPVEPDCVAFGRSPRALRLGAVFWGLC